MAIKNVLIGAVLKEYGYITEEQVGEALAFQRTEEGKGKRLGDLLLGLGFVTEQQVLEALGKKLELPLVRLEDVDVDEKAVARIPRSLLEKYSVLPLGESNGRMTLAMCDPLDFYAQEDIKQIANMPLDIVLCDRKSINAAIEFHYAEIAAKKATEQARVTDVELEMLARKNADGEEYALSYAVGGGRITGNLAAAAAVIGELYGAEIRRISEFRVNADGSPRRITLRLSGETELRSFDFDNNPQMG